MRKRLLIPLLLFLWVLGTHPAAAASSQVLEQMAEAVAADISAQPAASRSLFDKSFLQAVPWEKLAALYRELFQAYGPVSRVQLKKAASELEGQFEFHFAKNQAMPVTLSISSATPPTIIGLWFGPVKPVTDSFPQLFGEIRKLPGQTSLTVLELGDKPKALHEINPDAPLAIGSAFKLYILGALTEEIQAGRMHWQDLLPIRESHKSLPSGMLHRWPAGAPLTLNTMATLMISLSDNTATDHLLMHLGRAKVEAMLAKMGHSHVEQTLPFLATYEMFMLKADPRKLLAPAYLAANREGRRALLNDLARENTETNRARLVYDQSKPPWIEEIEWFASTRDLCLAMDWLRRQSQAGEAAKTRDVLAVNPGLPLEADQWRYIGYKGGSETGVLNLTYLVQRKDGKWFAVAATWNNPQAPLEEAQWFAYIQRLFALLAHHA